MNRTALITTTIHPPEALYLLRKYGPDAGMFVALEKEFNPDIGDVLHKVGAEPVYGDDYKCSELIGWRCIQRRNVALLEAIRWGADIIVSWDTDNLPLTRNYFVDFEYVLSRPFSGLQASGIGGWFDVGRLLDPPVSQRGIPLYAKGSYRVTHAVNAPVGVCQGLALGDPDVGALTRLATYPTVDRSSALLDAGVAFKPEHQSWTAFNTQNTAFLRELAPAMFCPPGCGRHDDIVASLVCQRVMRETGHVVHFGRPYAWQTRNPHDLVKDLKEELWGYENIQRLADRLDEMTLVQAPSDAEARAEFVVARVRAIYGALWMGEADWFPRRAAEAALAFCDDVEEILR